jgi:hypothetical protein
MSPSDAQQQRVIRSFVSSQLRMRKLPRQIEEALVERGLDREGARKLVRESMQSRQQTQQAVSRGGWVSMLFGGVLLLIGVGVLLTTYQMAASDPGGGTYLIPRAALAGGAVFFFGGLFQVLRARR